MESVIADAVRLAPEATIVIKSTIPVGFTEGVKAKLGVDNVFFSPEFLREGRALFDNLHPSRIVVGERSARAERFAASTRKCMQKEDIPVLLTDSTEAEAIKLFANTYLAMRVAFFNELDSYAMSHGLDTRSIIDGASILAWGRATTTPLLVMATVPAEDTQAAWRTISNVPQNLIRAIVDSNTTGRMWGLRHYCSPALRSWASTARHEGGL